MVDKILREFVMISQRVARFIRLHSTGASGAPNLQEVKSVYFLQRRARARAGMCLGARMTYYTVCARVKPAGGTGAAAETPRKPRSVNQKAVR